MESNLELVAPYKALLTSGCSWTDTRLTSNNWSRQLASDLEMIPLCKGMSGAGNQYIFESLVDSITSVKPETIGLVVAQWSQLDRYDVEGSEWMRFPLYAWPKKDRREFGYKREVFHDIISKSFNETTLEEMLYIWQRKQDRYSFALKQICKSLNIKLIEFQGTDKWCPVEHDLKLVKFTKEAAKDCYGNFHDFEKRQPDYLHYHLAESVDTTIAMAGMFQSKLWPSNFVRVFMKLPLCL